MEKEGWKKVLKYLIENGKEIYEEILGLEKSLM